MLYIPFLKLTARFPVGSSSLLGCQKTAYVQALVVGRVVNLRLLWYDLRPFLSVIGNLYIAITHWKVKSSAIKEG